MLEVLGAGSLKTPSHSPPRLQEKRMFGFYCNQPWSSNCLVAWVPGSGSDPQRVTELLQQFLQNQGLRPTEAFCTNWGSSRRFLGSYSYAAVDQDMEAWPMLRILHCRIASKKKRIFKPQALNSAVQGTLSKGHNSG